MSRYALLLQGASHFVRPKSVCMEKFFPSCRYPVKQALPHHWCVDRSVLFLPRVCLLTKYHVTDKRSNHHELTQNAMPVLAYRIGIDPYFIKPNPVASPIAVTVAVRCPLTFAPTRWLPFNLASCFGLTKTHAQTLRFCIPARCTIVSQEGSH